MTQTQQFYLGDYFFGIFNIYGLLKEQLIKNIRISNFCD